jgi:CBS domain containing-hemolysin-like protein
MGVTTNYLGHMATVKSVTTGDIIGIITLEDIIEVTSPKNIL